MVGWDKSKCGVRSHTHASAPSWDSTRESNRSRAGSAMAFDSTSVVLFGGSVGTDAMLNDTWLWNGTSWQQIWITGVAPAVQDAAWMPQSFDVTALQNGGLRVRFGMYMQNVMLLATERGLDTCPQEYWARYPQTVARFVGLPDDHMLFSGMALGYRDPEASINTLKASRDHLDLWCDLRGWD